MNKNKYLLALPIYNFWIIFILELRYKMQFECNKNVDCNILKTLHNTSIVPVL